MCPELGLNSLKPVQKRPLIHRDCVGQRFYPRFSVAKGSKIASLESRLLSNTG